MQRGFRQQRQCISLLLRAGWSLRGGITDRHSLLAGAAPLVQSLTGGIESPQEQRTHLGGEAPPEDHRAVVILVDVQRTTRVLARGLTGFGLPVDLAPAPDDALHVDRRAGPPHREQARLGRRGRDAGQSAHLRV